MPAVRAGIQRRHTTSLSHAAPLASLSAASSAGASTLERRRPLDDMGLAWMSGVHEASKAEVTRLSAKNLELTAKLQAGDSERRRLDSMLDAARQECNNLQARLSQLQRDHQRVQESSRPTSARSLKPVPVVLSTPPRASASISALAHSLREAEAAIALRDKELAAARARLSEQPAGEMRAFRVPDVPKLQPRPPNASVPPPGIVARLQADLQEAAEERRIARQQAQALRERVRELERLLGGAGGGGDPSDDRMAQELQDTRVRLTAAEARAQELDKRMQMSLNRQKEQAQQIAALKQRLQDAADQASLSESDRADAAVLSGQLRALQVTLNAERTSSQQLSERLRRAEEAERAMADKLREAKEAAARASAQARSERADLEAKNREELLRLREDGRAALAGETALREQSEADLAALRRRLAEMQADNSEITKMRDREAEGRGLYEREAAEMRARLDRQDADLATKDARLREREKSKNELAAALERNATRLREAEGELEGLRHQLSQSEAISGGRIELEAELAGLRQRLSEFESNVGKLNEALDRSEAERARLEEEVSRHSEARKVTDELRRKLDHAVAEASTLRDKATIDYAKAQDMERQLRIVEGRESALETDRRELQRQVDALSQELRMASGDAKEAQKFEKMLQVTEKARAELEKELANARAMVDRQRTQLQQAKEGLQREQDAREAAAIVASAKSSTKGTNDVELRRELAETMEKLAAVQAELSQKEEKWRLSSLKRHAEQSKLEAILRAAQENNEKLKKKADFLELTLLSQQKSMDKDRVRKIQDQLNERNRAIDQQMSRKDVHAAAAQRATFDETFESQMNALDSKIKRLGR